MRRITFDTIASAIGLLLAVLLLVAGGLLYWAYDFTNTQVQQQLTQQQIIFPSADSAAIKALPPDDASAMKAYAGQLMTTGAQAKTYADHFISVHLSEIAGGKTYAELPQDDPNRQTVMTASFLQASLFTSVLAFGVAAMAVGLGVVFVLLGVALRRTGRTMSAVGAAARSSTF